VGPAAVAGVRPSKARVLRLMRAAHLLAPTRVGHAHGPKAHDGTITTERPDQMWGMDATSCLTRREGTATVFVVVDHCAAECIGLHAAKPGTRFEAVEPLRQGIHALFGGYEAGIARGLHARHDHGSQYVSDYFQDELTCLGIVSSPAFVREPEGNGVAERFIRTLKEQLLWVRTFETVEELRQALLEFKDRYNRAWLFERHGHQTPAQVPRPALPEGRVRPTGLARREREGRRGAQSALEEGGRSLGIPQNLGHPVHQPVTINSVSTKSGAEQARFTPPLGKLCQIAILIVRKTLARRGPLPDIRGRTVGRARGGCPLPTHSRT
jgi:putative transposase